MGSNQFSIQVATVNGSGSQSSNQVLVRSLFRMGLPVGAKNLFPSNIAGLPTWFTIRVHPQGFTSRTEFSEIFIAMNPQTFEEDLGKIAQNGWCFYNSEIKLPAQIPGGLHMVSIPFRQLMDGVTDSVKLKKLLYNMAYVGVIAELLKIPDDVLNASLESQFMGKAKIIEPNQKAIQRGRNYAKENLTHLDFTYSVQEIPNANQGKILIDGNSASALGMVYGGCQFVSWYPITPSSSVVESFIRFANQVRRDEDGNPTYEVVQAEDELAAITMVIGAGWSGARAMTATSGPGLSLMAEAAGLAYYAEIPSVIWDVQRVGPSTGLPTRTMQGDLLSAHTLSHGDTKHVVLIPGTTEECFEFSKLSLDLSERLQTLIIGLSDLDLGMNLHISNEFKPFETLDRGKIVTEKDLESGVEFSRYKDVDGDGVPFRTLPGTAHPKAAFFTRGTGHDENANYSENNLIFKKNMNRLIQKYETAKNYVPKPIVNARDKKELGIIAYGSTREALPEVIQLLDKKQMKASTLELRALPLTKEVEDFIQDHKTVYVVEQNRDHQLRTILSSEYPQWASKLKSILQYDGLPLDAKHTAEMIMGVQ